MTPEELRALLVGTIRLPLEYDADRNQICNPDGIVAVATIDPMKSGSSQANEAVGRLLAAAVNALLPHLDRIAALEAKCDLLSASLKKADAERDAALEKVAEAARAVIDDADNRRAVEPSLVNLNALGDALRGASSKGEGR